MGTSLTKARCPRKACALAVLLLCAGSAMAEKNRLRETLRECIAGAAGPAGVVQCERREQNALQDDIERWSTAIRLRLDHRERVLFDRNSKAWRAFIESEQALLKKTLRRRSDKLGNSLYPGAVTRLYEERARQLREHLHNLSYGQL